jgi:hypothetical protein
MTIASDPASDFTEVHWEKPFRAVALLFAARWLSSDRRRGTGRTRTQSLPRKSVNDALGIACKECARYRSEIFGAPGEIRTPDPLVRNQELGVGIELSTV